MRTIKKIFFLFIPLIMCSCFDTEIIENSAPPILSVHYYFQKELSKEEVAEYIQDTESMGEVTSSIPLSNVPTENFSSNFLKEGTKLYFVDERIVAVYDDEEDFYAALLILHIE